MELKAETDDPRHIYEAPLLLSSHIINMLLFQLPISTQQRTTEQPLLSHESAIWARLSQDSLSLPHLVLLAT